MANIDLVHVPYKGAGPALPAVISGEVQMMITTVAGPLPYVRSGRLRALGTTSEKRLAVLPDVPAIGETVPGYEVMTWYGLFAPAGTPKPIIARLNAALATSLGGMETQDRVGALGAELSVSTPEQLAATLSRETARWAKLVKAAGIRTQ